MGLWRRISVSAVLWVAVVFAGGGCSTSPVDSSTLPSSTAPASTAQSSSTAVPEPTGEVAWHDPSKVLEFPDGWRVAACEGNGPLLCVERGGAAAGVVEALAFPLEENIDDPSAALAGFVAGYYEDIAADRAIGCGAGYRFVTDDPSEADVFGVDGASYGFTGTWPDGRPSERTLGFATVAAGRLVLAVASAHDPGGCIGTDEIVFTSPGLAEFAPHLRLVVSRLPVPVFLWETVD